MSKILIVDDEKNIRNSFKIFLEQEGHFVLLAENVEVALDLISNNEVDLIITDIVMPRMTGIELLARIKAINTEIPIIIMTGEPNVETAKAAIRDKAQDYLIKPVLKIDLIKSVKNALVQKDLIDQRNEVEKQNEFYRENLEKLVNKRTQSLQKAIKGTMSTIVKMLEKKDGYTAGHEKRVANLALAIANELNLSDEKKKSVYFAGFLHDTGKIFVSAEILSKPGTLSAEEFMIIKDHVTNGYELTKNIEFPWPICDIILQHHERLNGSGYPNGLKGDEILIEARILAVADVIEAMTAQRPYRSGFGMDKALDEIRKNKGLLYDDTVANAAIELFEKDHYELTDIPADLTI